MSRPDIEDALRTGLRRVIDPIVPSREAENRLMRQVHASMAPRSRSWRGVALDGNFRAVLVSSLVVLLVGGAVGFSVALRNRVVTPTPPKQPATSLPVVTTTPTSPTSTPSASPTVAACDGGALAARFTHFTGAAGTEGGDIVLENIGSVACTMKGYTNLQGVTGGHTVQLGVTHSIGGTILNNNNGTLPRVGLVTLPPGKDAYVAVEYSVVSSGGQSQCPAFMTLRITPPQAGHAVTMSPPAQILTLCAGHGAAIWIDEAPVSPIPYYPGP